MADRETFTRGRENFTGGREIFTRGLYVFGFWRETLAVRVGATPGATIGVGTGATTYRCNCLIISIRCAGCHQLSPFRLERAYTYAKSPYLCTAIRHSDHLPRGCRSPLRHSPWWRYAKGSKSAPVWLIARAGFLLTFHKACEKLFCSKTFFFQKKVVSL